MKKLEKRRERLVRVEMEETQGNGEKIKSGS